MNKTPLLTISIIIPAYNYAHTLERAILSVYNQIDSTCELIVINDGSTDNTENVLARYRNSDKNITLISKENGGPASARNVGIAHAKGSYLIFLDADDELYPNAISNIYKQLPQMTNSQFIIGAHYSIHQDHKIKLHTPNQLPIHNYDKLKAYLIDKTISISNGACLMHESIFKHYQYPEHLRNSEDISMFAFVLVNFSCTTINFPLVNIHKHDDSLRHNANYAESIGLDLVDEVFHPDRIPPELQALKKSFLVQRLLSLSRVSHENNRHEKCTFFSLKHLP